MEGDGGKNRTEYIYALGHDWATTPYDPRVRWTIRESAFKPAIIQQSGLRPSHRVLDLGCGTGTLTRGIKKELAEAPVVGLDEDGKILGLEDFARIPKWPCFRSQNPNHAPESHHQSCA